VIVELDEAYANAPFIPDAETFLERWPAAAAAFRAEMSGQGRLRSGLPYGPNPRQRYDLFLPDRSPSQGVLVFVHGGYWLRFDRTDWSHLAAGAVARGWAVAMPGYDLCPTVSIAEITGQIARAIGEIARGIAEVPIGLVGHSAGGHLVARMLAPGALPNWVLERVRAVVPMSPVADLRPLLRTSMNAQLKLSEEGAWSESPIAQAAPVTRVQIWVGAEERPVFVAQARALGLAWDVACVEVARRHHFDIIEQLEDAQSDMLAFLVP